MDVKENDRLIQCPECSDTLTYHPTGRNVDLLCDLCDKSLGVTEAIYTCLQNHRHYNGDSFDTCLNCLKRKKELFTFDLQRWLCRPGGQEWVKEVYIGGGTRKVVYSALPVQWEDIDRHSKSVSGDMIFDVIIRLKNKKEIRYVIRPNNLSDLVQSRPVSEITLPIGQVVSKPLRAITLKELLSSTNNYDSLHQCGLKSDITGELYEPIMDDKNNNKNNPGGISFSAGCALMSEEDVGQGYEIEVYMYQSNKYKNAKCLALVQTIDGTTASLLTPGKREILRFAKDNKECEWKIGKFDTSTAEGKKAQDTGCDPATDMIIYFIPVEFDQPEKKNNNNDSDSSSDDEGVSIGWQSYGGGGSRGGSRGGRGGSRGGRGGPRSHAKGKGKKLSTSMSLELAIPSNKRKRESSLRSLGFAKHEMTISDRKFISVETNFPLRRIRTLPIRGFLRGALFIDQTSAPTRHDAVALSDYLQTKYLDTKLTTIWGYSAQARARSKILSIYKEDKIYSEKGGTFTTEYTKFAIENHENCVICLCEPITHVLLNCGHMCLCIECSKKWKESCPICRNKIKKCVSEMEVDKNKVNIIPQAVKE